MAGIYSDCSTREINNNSPAATACSRFVAEGPAGSNINRLLLGTSAAGAATFQSISTAARQSAANASSVTFTAAVGS